MHPDLNGSNHYLNTLLTLNNSNASLNNSKALPWTFQIHLALQGKTNGLHLALQGNRKKPYLALQAKMKRLYLALQAKRNRPYLALHAKRNRRSKPGPQPHSAGLKN
jgi:hypothetical protein